MNFSEKRSCACVGTGGIEYDESILVYKDSVTNWIGHILFSGSIVRFVDGESNYDYTVSDLKAIMEKMEGK